MLTNIVLGVARTLELQRRALWAVFIDAMPIANFVEEVNIFTIQYQGGSNRMHRRVPPSLVKEPSSLIQQLKVVRVGLRSKK